MANIAEKALIFISAPAACHDALHSDAPHFKRGVARAKNALADVRVCGSRQDLVLASARLSSARGRKLFAKASVLPALMFGENTFGMSYGKWAVRILEKHNQFDNALDKMRKYEMLAMKLPAQREGLVPHMLGLGLMLSGAVIGAIGGLTVGTVLGVATNLFGKDAAVPRITLGAIFGVGAGLTLGAAAGGLAGLLSGVIVAQALGTVNLALRGGMVGIGGLLGYGYGAAAGAMAAARHRPCKYVDFQSVVLDAPSPGSQPTTA